MEEMLITYQDALHALSEMQDVLDTIDSEEISPHAFGHLIETYKEAHKLFISFLAEYIENIIQTPIESHKPFDILTAAHAEKIITGKEFKQLSGQLNNPNLLQIPETDDDAQDMIEVLTTLQNTMQDILEGMEI